MISTRAFIGMGFALALLGFVVRCHDNIGFGVRTAAVLIEAIPGNIPTVLDFRAPPRVSTVMYRTRDGFDLQADVYEPVGADGEAALILVNGVEPAGRKYRPLVDFADGLARSGFVVLVPDALDYSNYRVLPQDVGALVRGFEILSERESVDRDRIGFIGFSMGGSLAMVASADEAIADQVAMVVAVGAYYSLEAMIQAVTTNTVRAGGVNEPYMPDPHVWIVLRNTLLSQVANQADREMLFKLFSLSSPELMREQGQALKLEPIGDQGRRIHALLINRDPDSVGWLASQVREVMPGLFESISPRHHFKNLTVFVALLHDANDPYVPVQESIRAYRALGGSSHARLEMLDVMKHAEIAPLDSSLPDLIGSYIPGMLRLFTFTYDSLRLIEAGA